MDVNKVLNAERFDLLSEDEQIAVNNLRDLGQIEPAYNKLDADEINAFKETLNYFLPNSSEYTDYDYANFYGNYAKTKEFATSPGLWKEIAITGAGIAGPMVLPGVGQATLPARVAYFIQKYPRMAKIFSAFAGGSGAAKAIGEDNMAAMGYGVREMAGEGAVQAITGAYPIMKAGLQRAAASDVEEGAEVALRQLEGSGQILTPSIISNNRVIETLENISENAWIGGGVIREARSGAIEAAQKNLGEYLNTKFVMGNKEIDGISDDFVTAFLNNASEESMDIVLKDFVTKGASVQKSLIKTGYRNLDTIIQKTTGNADIVNINGLKSFAKNQSKLNIDDASKKLLNDIAALPDNVSFAQAQRLRSQFLEKTGYYTEGGTTATGFSKAIAGGAQKIIDGSMDKAVKNLSKNSNLSKETVQQVNDAWRGVNKLYKESKLTFNSSTMTKIINGDSDLVYTSLIKGKHPARIKEFRNLIFNTAVKQGVLPNKIAATQLWRKVQGEFFVDMIGRSIDGQTGTLSAKSLLQKLKTFSGRGDRTLNELFANSPEILTQFKSFARTLELAQSKGIKGVPGGMFIQLTQAQAIPRGIQAGAGILAGMDGNISFGEGVGLGIILGGPKVVAKMFTDPRFVKGIFATTRNKIGTQNYTRGAVQVINSYITQGLFTEDQAKSSIEEGIQTGVLHKNALKLLNSEQKKLDYKENVKKTNEKTKKFMNKKFTEFAEYTGLS